VKRAVIGEASLKANLKESGDENFVGYPSRLNYGLEALHLDSKLAASRRRR